MRLKLSSALNSAEILSNLAYHQRPPEYIQDRVSSRFLRLHSSVGLQSRWKLTGVFLSKRERFDRTMTTVYILLCELVDTGLSSLKSKECSQGNRKVS